MKRSAVLFLVLSLLAFVAAATVHAQTAYKWSDIKARGSFGVEGGYAWHTGTETNLPSIRKEWQAGVVGAYNLVPNLSASAYVVRGFDNRTWRASLGPRMTVWRSPDAKQSAAVGLAYAWHAGPKENLPTFPHEFEGNAYWGMAVTDRIVLGASTGYGLDNKTFRSVIGATYALAGGVK